MKKVLIFLTTFLIVLIQYGTSASVQKQSFQKPSVIGLTARMNINNIDLALANNGNYGLDGDTYYPNGSTKSFLFAGGLGISGYDQSGQLKVSWMMSASRIYEFQAGLWGMDPDDPKAIFYEVNKEDDFGSANYVKWADAVALGADFVDLNNDGAYDPAVDMPDLLGDKTIWYVFNDGVVQANRGLVDSKPNGVSVFQSVFAFKRSDDLGNVIFMRYRIRNDSGGDLNDVIFSVINDPDLGEYSDDLIGCDTTLSLGFIYNPGADDVYGENVPAYGVDFFQGPIVDSPGDTAYKFLGPLKGVVKLADKKNLPMTSFMYYIQGDPVLGDPDFPEEARRYMEGGLDINGNPIVSQDFTYGNKYPNANPKFMYSGDPVTGTGWLDSPPDDKRFMLSSGPFPLKNGDIQDVVIGLVIGQGDNHLSSVTRLRETDQKAQIVYNTNFDLAGPPPIPEFTVADVDGKVRIAINLEDVINYYDEDDAGSKLVFQGLAVYQYRSGNTASVLNGIQNERLVAAYDVDDEYVNIYVKDQSLRYLAWKGVSNLSRQDKGLIVELTGDAFNSNLPFTPGKTYYFAVVPFSIDENNITQLTPTDWEVSPAGILFAGKNAGFFSVTIGENELKVFDRGETGDDVVQRTGGNSDGKVDVIVTDPTAITGHQYEVSVNRTSYYYTWSVKDLATGEMKVENNPTFGNLGDETAYTFPIVDGMMIRIFNPELPNLDANPPADTIYQTEGSDDLYFNIVVLDYIWNYTTYYTYLIGPNAAFGQHYRLVLDTEQKYVGHVITFGDHGYEFVDTTKTYVAVYDISDPANPVQVNVSIRDIGATKDLDMLSGERGFIHLSLYSEDPFPTGDDHVVGDAIATYRFALKSGRSLREEKVAFDFLFSVPNRMTSADKFVINTANLKTQLTDADKKDLMAKVNVVPNPYWAYSQYETSYDSPLLKFTHIPGKATIRIFNLAGQLVRTIQKTDETNPFVTWDLRNDAGLKVASGMYIAHVEVPGVGEKVLKLAIIQREERIDQY